MTTLLDEHELDLREKIRHVEQKVEHTNSLLEAFLTEHKAETNEFQNILKNIDNRLKGAGL